MPIDARMREVWLKEPTGFRAANAYTAHNTTCPYKNQPETTNKENKKP